MGHSSINVTMDVYGHLMPGGGGEVADRLGALVFGGSGSITVECDELELADDAQAIVSIGAPVFDKRIEASGTGMAAARPGNADLNQTPAASSCRRVVS